MDRMPKLDVWSEDNGFEIRKEDQMSLEQHATVRVDGMVLPLIGIPKGATLEECALCHDEFHICDVEWTGKQMLCKKCREIKTSSQ